MPRHPRPDKPHNNVSRNLNTPLHITSDGIAIFPELHGTSLALLDSPKFYLPDNISIVTSNAFQQMEELSPTDIQRLRDLHIKVATLQQTFDVDSLLHIQRTTMPHKLNTHSFIIITTSICATLILGTISFLFYFRFHYILRIIPKPNNTSEDKKNQLHVTFCILYFSSNSCSTFFGQPCAHHQELTTA